MQSFIQSVQFSSTPINGSPHYHDCHQLLFVTKGQADILLNNRKFLLSSGEILILSRFEQHSIRSATPDYERFILKIEPQMQSSDHPRLFSLLLNRPKNFNNVIAVGADFELVRGIFQLLIAERQNARVLNETMTDLLLHQLMIYIYRHVQLDYSRYPSSTFSMVSSVQSLLSTHYQTDFTLQKIADALSVSPSLLSHSFKEITGMSVMRFLLSCRITEAKKQLIETERPIGLIAEQCGFSDFSNFCRFFKRETGYTPSQYIKTYKQ